MRPKRSVLFLSTTGEEVGLLGSEFYVEHPVYPLQQIWAVMNIDMLGARDTIYEKQPLTEYVYATYSDSLKHGIEIAFTNANEVLRLKIETSRQHSNEFRRNLSDGAPFYAKGIPVLSFHVGETRDYHEVTDTPDKVNFALLKKHTQLVFLTLWNLAND